MIGELSAVTRFGDTYDFVLPFSYGEADLTDDPVRPLTVNSRLEGLIGMRLFIARFVRDQMAQLATHQEEIVSMIEEELSR